MRIKVNYVYQDDLEYRTTWIDHPKASAEVVQVFLALKYRLFGLKLFPEVRDQSVYLKIPVHRDQLKLVRSQIERVSQMSEHACIRLSDHGAACENCGKDHALSDLAELILNPKCVDPVDPVLARLPMLVPEMPAAVWTWKGSIAGPMSLN